MSSIQLPESDTPSLGELVTDGRNLRDMMNVAAWMGWEKGKLGGEGEGKKRRTDFSEV